MTGGLTLRQLQSGNSNIKGHISKRGSSILRFVKNNAAHSVIRF
ncbi:transposase [Cuniculiplasma sp. SKW4]